MKAAKGLFSDLLGVGGAPCLDFANTISGRGHSAEFDRLACYDHMLGWASAFRLLPDFEIARLRETADSASGAAIKCFSSALAFREAFYRVAIGMVEGSIPRTNATELSARLFPIIAKSILKPTASNELVLALRDPGAQLEAPLWFAAWSAMELLRNHHRGQLRQCENTDCTWLFLDKSRNRSRRWCSMDQCGAIIKARQYRARNRMR
jgi:predicted RNA-binding Zn ribbon-like protein